MPRKITKVKDGYKVCDKKKCFSDKSLTYSRALAQFRAILISERKKNK